MDHVSDLFLETSMPLLVLIEAAKAGNEQQVEEFSQLFHDHANKLIEVSAIQHFCFMLFVIIRAVERLIFLIALLMVFIFLTHN